MGYGVRARVPAQATMILLLLALCFGDIVNGAYADQDVTTLRTLFTQAPTREDSLLLRYRLFALTREQAVVADIPTSLDSATARELALLSALWGYRIREVGPVQFYIYGRRTMTLLQEALERDPDDPLVTLIDAQSLLFRPGIAGGDGTRAVERLRTLGERMGGPLACGVDPLEAEVWLWYALHKTKSPEADSLWTRLQAVELPSLYREFLDGPP